MKALKEKRVSLRSFLRRGLVILSLFAIALAFGSCGDSGGDDTPSGTGPTGSTPPPPPPKKVVSLTILQQPVNESYQGFAPDLTGLIVQVNWDDGTVDPAETDITKFFTSPGYCDIAWPGNGDETKPETYGDGTDPYTGLSLGYVGQTALSNQLKIPMVVGATKIDITGTPQPWYGDERPDFAGLAYEITYEQGWLGLGTNSVAGVPNGGKKLRAPMTPVYPNVDYARAAVDKKIGVYVGPALNGQSGIDGGLAGATGLSRAAKTNTALGSFWVPAYYGVAGVEVSPGTPWDVYFDDDIDRFYTRGAIDATKVYAELKKSNVKFDITYVGTDRQKTITVDEFIGNSMWYKGLGSVQGLTSAMGNLSTLIFTTDGFRWIPGQGGTSVLYYGKDEDNDEAWRVTLDYAPWNFGYSAAFTHVDVAFPLYLYDDLAAVKTAAGPVTIYGTNADGGSGIGSKTMNQLELDAIKTKWKLQGTYVSGRSKQYKTIGLTSQIFYDGFYGASAGSAGVTSLNTSYLSMSGSLFGANISTMGGYNSIGDVNTSLVSGELRRDYPLPVYYRGILISDDEGVLVNLVAP